MKKVVASAAGILFAVFGIAILGLLMSLTFGALGKLFPDNFTNQIWGLVLFDIAAMIWALVFVFKCQSTGQYAIAAIGFIAAFVGTLGMVAVEVMMSGQSYVEVAPWVGQWLVYGFVIMTALHSALLYGHHATAPEIHEKINVGVARGEIVTEAIRQATQSLEVQKAELAESIHHEIVNQVKRDLGLARGQVLDLPALPVDSPQAEPMAKQGAPSWLLNMRRRFARKPAPAPVTVYEVGVNSLSDPTPITPPAAPIATTHPHKNPYALPCGHTEGARPNYETGLYECKVCGKSFNIEERPAPSPKPADNLFPMPLHEEPGEQPAPFQDGEGSTSQS